MGLLVATKYAEDAEGIVECALELEEEYRDQAREDQAVKDILQRQQGVDAQPGEGGLPVKRLLTGYPALVVMQDYSFLTAPPFMRVNFLDPEQERKSDKLESGLQGCIKLSQGRSNTWLDQVYDFVWCGRGFSTVTYIPEIWGSKLKQDDEEPDNDYLKRVDRYKMTRFPIVWKHIPAENTWPKFDIRGDIEKLVSIREMKVGTLRRHYPNNNLPNYFSNTDKIKIVEYYSENECSTVAYSTEGKPFSDKIWEWEHMIGVCPISMVESARSSPPMGKIEWNGILYHTKDMLGELDSLLTDIRYNVKRAVRSSPIFNLDLQNREVPPEERGKGLPFKVEPLKPIVLDINEGVKELDPARTNVDAYKLVEILTGFTREIAIRSVLLGILQSGTTGILYNTAAQFAQKQYGPAISQLEKGAVKVGELFFLNISCFLKEGEKLPIVYTQDNGNVAKLELTAKDVQGWERTIQARIDLSIPVNESSDITNARLVTDPNNPLMSYDTAAARYLKIENPTQEKDKILRDQIHMAMTPSLIQLVQQEGLAISQQPSDPNQLAEMFQSLSPGIQSAIANHATKVGGAVPEAAQITRGSANTAKVGRPQMQNPQRIGQVSPTSSSGY